MECLVRSGRQGFFESGWRGSKGRVFSGKEGERESKVEMEGIPSREKRRTASFAVRSKNVIE